MKRLLSIVMTVILLLVFAAFALGSEDDETTSVEKNSSKETASSQKNTSDKRTEIRVGETLNANDFKITFDSAEKWSSTNQFIQPADGKQFIRLHLSIANETGADHLVNAYDFACYADGEKCDTKVIAIDDMLSFDTISPGRKISGYIYYEVPVNSTEIEVEYETSFWTNKKAYFIVEL